MAQVIQLALGGNMSNLGVKAAPSLGKPMSTICNLMRKKLQTLGRVNDCEKRAVLKSIWCQLCDQVRQIYLRKYIFQDMLKDLKLTII